MKGPPDSIRHNGVHSTSCLRLEQPPEFRKVRETTLRQRARSRLRRQQRTTSFPRWERRSIASEHCSFDGQTLRHKIRRAEISFQSIDEPFAPTIDQRSISDRQRCSDFPEVGLHRRLEIPQRIRTRNFRKLCYSLHVLATHAVKRCEGVAAAVYDSWTEH